jgi:hypothetical protein
MRRSLYGLSAPSPGFGPLATSRPAWRDGGPKTCRQMCHNRRNMSASDTPHERATRAAALISIGAVAIWAWVDLPRIDHPMGSDWAQYFTVAEIIWHDDPHLYPPFRKPFFGLVLGLFGEYLGYLNAAQLIGRLCAVLMVIAAGMGAWALVGPIAGVLASCFVVLMPLVMDGALWVNNYPLLGASSSMALAAGAAMCRWPRLGWALVAGASAGMATALDVRGIVVVPAVVALLVLGLPWGQWRRVGLLCLALAGPLVSFMAYDGWLTRTFEVPQFTLESQLRVQRQAVLEPIRRGQYVDTPALQDACGDVTASQPALQPWVEVLDLYRTDSCASALSHYSYGPLRDNRILPGPLTLMLLPLTLLPIAWRRERRTWFQSSAASLVVFGIPTLTVLTGMSWVFYSDRYLLPFGGVLAMLVPVALGRLFGAVLRFDRRFAAWIGTGVAASCWAAWVWPGLDARSLNAPETVKRADYAAGVMAMWAEENVGQEDQVIDCGGLAMDYLLLPQRIAYVRHPPGDPSCEDRIRFPSTSSGQTYLITPILLGQTDLAGDPVAIAALGWDPISVPRGIERYRLWQHSGR